MRVERRRAKNRAHLRFYLTMLFLLAVAVLLAFGVWLKTQELFGI